MTTEPMDKRTATISSRVPADLEHQLQMIAVARNVSLSDLICHRLLEFVEEERRRYLQYRAAFEGAPDLPGQPGQPDPQR